MTERVKGGSERVWGADEPFGVIGGLESDDSLSVYLHGRYDSLETAKL